MIDSNCEGCFFATPNITDDNDFITKCRRYPPVLFVLDEQVMQGFPDATERCGEFRQESFGELFMKQPTPYGMDG